MRIKPVALGSVLLFTCGLAAAQVNSRAVGEHFASRSPVHAQQSAVATTHPLATGVGLDILRRGGSAMDAALAANAVIGVTEPMNTGIGGDVFAIVWDPKTKRLYGFNGSGRSPAGLSFAKLKRTLGADARALPARGPLAVSVPGAVDGWFQLHARFGKLPMKDLLAPAVGYARGGFPVAVMTAYYWKQDVASIQAASGAFDNFHAVFTRDSQAPVAGEVFRNPQMADTLTMIANEGSEVFYRGRIAHSIERYMRRIGGPLRAADLAAHRGEWVEPVGVRYRGFDVYELPPNTQGAVALQVLNVLEGYDLKAMGAGSADYRHVLIEAIKLAFEDRVDYYADPAVAATPLSKLLSKEYATERRRLIDRGHARAARSVVSPARHTTYLTVADRDGMMVSLISSLFDGFGSGLVPDGLGFALQSRASGFSLLDGHANVYAPGKRPLHTLMPGFAMKDGVPWMSFGVLGGSFQPQGHVQILVNMIDFGMNAQEAGDAARMAVTGGAEPWDPRSARSHVILVEPGVSDAVVAELKRRGHEVKRPVGEFAFGGYQGIRRDPVTGVYEAASEMRMDGMAAGY